MRKALKLSSDMHYLWSDLHHLLSDLHYLWSDLHHLSSDLHYLWCTAHALLGSQEKEDDYAGSENFTPH